MALNQILFCSQSVVAYNWVHNSCYICCMPVGKLIANTNHWCVYTPWFHMNHYLLLYELICIPTSNTVSLHASSSIASCNIIRCENLTITICSITFLPLSLNLSFLSLCLSPESNVSGGQSKP